MSLLLMRGQTLTTGTTSSLALMLVADELTVDFDLSCSSGPSIVTYYIEYSEDLVTWFREVAEENAGKGIVLMPAALRTLTDNNSTAIADNASFKASCQFTRQAPFARIQMSASTGTVVVTSVVAASGNGPYGTNVVTAAPLPPCPPPPPTEAGLFTLTNASGPALILATMPYDFSCLVNANVHLAGTVDSKRDVASGHLFPVYGIFVVTVVPPVADLFVSVLPVVQMTTTLQLDSFFHTYAAASTFANPGAGKTIIFAALPDSSGTTLLTPTNYQYQNFTFAVTGV